MYYWVLNKAGDIIGESDDRATAEEMALIFGGVVMEDEEQ